MSFSNKLFTKAFKNCQQTKNYREFSHLVSLCGLVEVVNVMFSVFLNLSLDNGPIMFGILITTVHAQR